MTEPPAGEATLVETLAAGVAHEVRNPLNSVQIHLGILEQELAELLPDRSAHPFELLARIGAQLKRLDDFVSEFLRFARLPPLERQQVAIRPLLADLAAFMAPECATKGVRLELELAGPEAASVDRLQLKRAVLNLVLNALQASGAGGRVTLRTAGDERRLLVSVADDGQGMTAHTRENAFTPFFTTREGGTGLGLAVVQRVVERHGGSVAIDSAPGRGTTVTLVFPAPAGA